MESLKITEASWTDQTESELDAMSTTAAEIVSNEDEYPLVTTEALALTNASNAYHGAYSRYKRGKGTKDDKDIAKSDLYKAHAAVAKKLEETAAGNADYMTRPGYRLEEEGGRPSTARVPAPTLQKADSSKVRGRVQFILKAADTLEIKGVIGKYSEDNGVTWIEGKIVEFALNFYLYGQASGKAVLYQFKFKATSGRESFWSDVIRVEVF